MQVFELEKSDYIELNKLLKIMNLASSGGEAKVRIDSGEVRVNGKVETQRRKKLVVGDVIEVANESIRIQRAAIS